MSLSSMLGSKMTEEEVSEEEVPAPLFKDTLSLNLELDRLSKSFSVQANAAEEAHNLLNSVEVWVKKHSQRWSNERTEQHFAIPDTVSYTSVIDAWSKSEQNRTLAAFQANTLLQQMEYFHNQSKLHQQFTRDVHPNTVTYNAVMNAFSRSTEEYQHDQLTNTTTTTTTTTTTSLQDQKMPVPQRLESILNHMHTLYQTGHNIHCRPDRTSYNTVMQAWANSNAPNAGTRAEALLNQLWTQYITITTAATTPLEKTNIDQIDNLSKLKPNAFSYAMVLAAWSRSSSFSFTTSPKDDPTSAMEIAYHSEQLLEQMEQRSKQYPNHHKDDLVDLSLQPTTACINSVLQAYSRISSLSSPSFQQRRKSAKRAQQILQRMEHLSDFYDRPNIGPNVASYNIVLAALARSDERNSQRRAETLLRHMYQRSLGGIRKKSNTNNEEQQIKEFPPDPSCEPNAISYNIVIYAWARCATREYNAAHRAESILRHMDRRYAAGQSNVPPDVTTYTTVIDAWSKQRPVPNYNKNNNNNNSKNNNHDEAVRRTDALLERMEEVSTGTFEEGYNPSAKPTVMTYNAACNVYAKSSSADNDNDAADRALALLRKMQLLGKHDESVRPDVFTYTSVIDALAKKASVESAAMAQDLLSQMEEEQDDHDEEEEGGGGGIRPNVRTYTSVIHAIARGKDKGAPHQAQAILHRMEQRYKKQQQQQQTQKQQQHNDIVRPDVVCYNSVINAWGWSTHESDKAKNAYILWKRMSYLYQTGQNNHVCPDIVTCNSVLNACAHTKRPSEFHAALQVAIELLDGIREECPTYGRPNHLTYGTMLMAISNLLPEEEEQQQREELAQTVFWYAAQEGHVSGYVLSNLKKAVSTPILLSLLGRDAVTIEKKVINNIEEEEEEGQKVYKTKVSYDIYKLPSSWTRYAGGRKSRPSRKSFDASLDETKRRVRRQQKQQEQQQQRKQRGERSGNVGNFQRDRDWEEDNEDGYSEP